MLAVGQQTVPMELDPNEVAARGERIYAERFRLDYEREHAGKFAAIDVDSGDAYLGETSGDALAAGEAAAPTAVFYLIRVGADAAFQIASVDGTALRQVIP